MGGMVLETNMSEILLRVQEQDKLEKQEVCTMSTILISSTTHKSMDTFRLGSRLHRQGQYLPSGT